MTKRRGAARTHWRRWHRYAEEEDLAKPRDDDTLGRRHRAFDSDNSAVVRSLGQKGIEEDTQDSKNDEMHASSGISKWRSVIKHWGPLPRLPDLSIVA